MKNLINILNKVSDMDIGISHIICKRGGVNFIILDRSKGLRIIETVKSPKIML